MNLKLKVKQHLKENKWHYILLISIFVLGMFLGYQKVYSLQGEVKAHLLELINNYLLGGYKGELSGNHIFLSAYFQQFKSIFLIWFLGLTVIGVPFILGVIFFRGFSLGFTVGFLVQEKASAGVIVTILSILPQNIVYIPLIIVWALIAINFSVYIVKGRDSGGLPLTKGIIRYFILLVFFTTLIAVGILIEAYLSPWFLGLIL
ncbi:MAG TPA: stage II sporulation protein M [Syntrophomonadaceae bacterium]|nr:stage II sporulation protein M [Syntrophomonadaceae bacterium]